MRGGVLPVAPCVSAEQDAAIRLVGVCKRYRDGFVALQDVELAVRQGELLSLLGASGCGKSTLLRLMAGLSRPSAGTIAWGSGGPDGARLALVPQEPTLMPWRRVFDNVRLPLQLGGRSQRQSRDAVMAALDAMGLSGVSDAFPRQLSGGMRMRVSIARALVCEPALLLMDEPFAALDELTRSRLNDELLTLQERRRLTIVFVTHSVSEAAYLSSRIVVMRARPGRIACEIVPGLPRGVSRGDAGYLAACARISQALEFASGAA